MTPGTATLIQPSPDIPGVLERLVVFARLLRDNGFGVGSADVIDAVRVLDIGMIPDKHELRRTLGTLFCHRKSERGRFDEMFDAFWLDRIQYKRTLYRTTPGSHGGVERKQDGTKPGTAPGAGLASYFDWARRDAGGEDEAEEKDGLNKLGGASPRATAARADIGKIDDPDELQRLMELAARLGARMRTRLTRRLKQSQKGRVIDMRRTLRASVSNGAELIELLRKDRKPAPLRLVVFVDVSGSMDAYSLFFVRFAHALTCGFADADTFVFHTRLVHIGSATGQADPVKMMQKLALMSQGWSGGTRIGDAIQTFNRSYAKSICSSRTVAIILSDGYDTGDASQLGEELRQLKRRVRKLVWLNPLLGRASYAPVASGMSAALKHVDLFAPAHNLESLMRLEDALVAL